MAYKLFSRASKALDCSFHQEILARTGRSTRCLRGRGITAVMKEKYYKDYVYRGGALCEQRAAVGGTKKPGRGGGMARGRQVDNEIQRWVQEGAAQGATPLKPPRGLERSKDPKGKEGTQALHPFSRAFIALTQRLHLTPVATQVVVRNEQCNIATLVDAVFLNAKGRIVVVELKTGFEGYNDVSTGRMLAEFAYLTNAPASQHRVQLAFTKEMFEMTFPEFGDVDGLLIRMTSTGAHVRSLDQRDSAAARAAMRKGSKF